MANQGTGTSQALAHSQAERLARLPGSYRDPKAITDRLQYAAENFHLVSPATACGVVPEGCSISLSTVVIDVENETYDVGGKRGLSKVALDKIGAAAGISWDARQSGRIDDGSDPYYCAWRAVGRMRHLDGTEVQLVGTKEMDLRPGSAQLEALNERYQSKLATWEKNGRRGYEPKSPEGQVREMRLHILAHAESKARLRAIRSIGIRPAYSDVELKKPFVVAKIMWTGQSSDPELQRMFALKQADAMIGGSRALYGDSAPAPVPAQLAPPALGAVRPPPVNRSRNDDDDDYESASGRTIDIPAAQPTPTPTTTSRAAAPPAAAQPAPTGSGKPASGLVMKFGRARGKTIEEASERDLEWYADAIEKSVDDPDKARFRDANLREVAAIRAELAYRRGEPATPQQAPAPAAPPPPADFGDDYAGGSDDDIPF